MKNQCWRSVVVMLTTFGLALSSIAPPALAQTRSTTRSSETYTRSSSEFAPGDGIRIKAWRDVSIPGTSDVGGLGLNDDFIIDSRGNITLPIVGEIRATGHSRRSLARVIEDTLGIRAIRISCSPLIRVTLFGAVNKPGSYLTEPKESLWGLINEAGGPANNADIKKIYVERSGQVVVKDLRQAFEQAHSLEQLGVRSGDQIYVPGVSRFNFRIIVDYVTLTTSFILLYFQFRDINRRNNN
jgi:protein involved in polysaccharide export with SLBB domain